MKRSEAKEYLTVQEPFFLGQSKTINGKHSFICPCCDNGSGRDGTGIMMIPRSNEHPRYKCFKCGESGDIFNLAQLYTGKDFKEAFEYLCDEYGLELDGYDSSNRKPFVPNRVSSRDLWIEPEEEYEDQTEFLRRAEENLDPSYLNRRGISLETQRHYHVGTVNDWINPKTQARFEAEGKPIGSFMYSPRCIIPTTSSSYLARDIRTDIPKKSEKYQKQKYGKVSLFGLNDIKNAKVFAITEGEIDGMSIYEATKGEIPAAGLGSTSNVRLIYDAILIDGVFPENGVILALDNDSAGIAAREKLAEFFENTGIPYSILQYDGKDPNEALKKDREAFKKAIESALEELTEDLEMGERG